MSLRLFILLLLAPALFAQDPVSFPKIQAALNDGLYPLAEQKIWEALSTKRTPDEEAALNILLMRALAGQKKTDDAVILSDESAHLPQQDAFVYWRARILFDAGRFQEVFQTVKSLPENSVYAPAALRLKGRAEQLAGDSLAAQKTFESFRKQFPDDESAAQNLLDLASIYLARNEKDNATGALNELLERFPDNAAASAARLEAGRQLIANGTAEDLKKAAILLTTLGSDETANQRLRSSAWVELSALEQRAGNASAAIAALDKAVKLTGDIELKVRQKAALANLLIEENKTKEAFLLFDEAIRSPDIATATAAEILLQKAEALRKTQQVTEAEQAFQACLEITADPALQARAQAGKGWSLWEQKRYEEAALAFETAGAKCTQTENCVTAFVRAGDARLAAKQYEKSRENYRRINQNYPEHPQAAQARYQSGVASLLCGQTDAALSEFAQTEKDFPQSEFASQAALQIAELFKSEKKQEQALEQYRRIIATYTNAVVQSAALLQQGLILYDNGQWDSAQESFRAISENHPNSIEAPQALYMSGFSRDKQGDTKGALEICLAFMDKYPGSEWAPDVLFWIGKIYYNSGDYVRAETAFLDIASRFPKHELTDKALFWGGTAMLKQKKFVEAFTAFSRIVKEIPNSPLILKARFAQGEALSELGEFSRAILAYEELIKIAPDDPDLSDRARGRLGDCLFILGTNDPKRYQEALTVYQSLYKRSSTPFALRLQAIYKIGRCEAKLGLKEKAFAHYMEAVYSGAEQTEPLSPDAVSWFTRAAFDAAAILEQQRQWKEAINIYARIIQAGVPTRNEAQKRIEKIERDHASAL
ncbi:MAG: tetratricopeptide repeat protein [Pontiellaceae bacterium]|jgi:TolA-binding protein|nr:tetratricopeptide repeat protein [Pontiellaceae bacterium]